MECTLGRIVANAVEMKRWGLFLVLWLLVLLPLCAQLPERTLRYTPDGEDFLIVNGNKKFNRALYGGHTAFRVETGDVPEFALYLPRLGGTLSFYITVNGKKKSLNDAQTIECRYRAGSRLYTITDSLLGKGKLEITVLALYDFDAAVWKITGSRLPAGTQLEWRFGGASDKRFSREGDMGVDPPDCFDFKPDNCVGNIYTITDNTFQLRFGQKSKTGERVLVGRFPESAELTVDELPALYGTLTLKNSTANYILLGLEGTPENEPLNHLFEQAEKSRTELAGRIQFKTPDTYINLLGGALSVAADAVWDGKVWLHGAIGWRMPLCGWRAAYTGDLLGWHDRARSHFNNYAASQVTEVEPVLEHPQQDSALNLARSLKQWGTPMYSNGYICRNPNRNDQMHHYDMNLCYIDELLWHLNWTGDWVYAREIWPLLTRHLAWEKRNFDPDNDGLYDAYCCIWASDALYYNAGAVTHSSAYNYRANKIAAMIGRHLGYSTEAEQYQKEADKILKAMNERLWLEDNGVWAEYQDYMGLKRKHESPAVWTVYHAIDAGVATPEQAYSATCFIDSMIPHIPVRAQGLNALSDSLGYNEYQTISTSTWQPYSWSINNVAFSEVMSTALAYWQAGRNEEAYHLFKSSVLDGMYLGGSPGNFGQISTYDVARSECYRDFSDVVGTASRALIQGLYGVLPDRLNKRLVIRPGFPKTWNYAELKTPDINYTYIKTSYSDFINVILSPSFNTDTVVWQIRASHEYVSAVTSDADEFIDWRLIPDCVGTPMIEVTTVSRGSLSLNVEIEWGGNELEEQLIDVAAASDVPLFYECKQGEMEWLQAVHPSLKQTLYKGTVVPQLFKEVDSEHLDMVDMKPCFNDSITNLFKPRYFSPRPPYTTLQIPLQGIGEWCHPKATFAVEDDALRAGEQLQTSLGVSFKTAVTGNNILFTSLWDNFPNEATVPLSGQASHAYLLMAGSTNAMQCHIPNGVVRIYYEDGTCDSLLLINPETWCPIEQDYYNDGYAFKLETERPYRLSLKTGEVGQTLSSTMTTANEKTAATSVDLNQTGIFGNELKGGAAMLLDVPLKRDKTLSRLSLETLSNDVVIGLLAITLQR